MSDPTLPSAGPERSGLHIPEPAGRPGDEPCFRDLVVPPAGGISRPSVGVAECELREYPYVLIRVLNDDHHAVGEWNPHLDPETLRNGLRIMMLTRAFDDRMLRSQRQGKTSFYLKSTGEEAVAVASAFALDPSDMLFPSYRQQGLLIARGWPMIEMMNQIYSNAADRLKGRQLPVMYSAKDVNFYSISGNLGTRFAHAVGWAMASVYKRDSRIAAAWIGEGSSAEGDFHYAMTFATVYRAPVILNLVNNQWAISTFQGIAGGLATTFAARAIGYGLPGLRVDGNDFLAVYAATRWAAERARRGHGATLIELYTYRAAAHSSSDDPTRYRPESEAAAWPLGDPIERLKGHLITIGEWSEERHAAIASQVSEEVRQAAKAAETIGTLGEHRVDSATMFDDVFKEVPPHLVRQRSELLGSAP